VTITLADFWQFAALVAIEQMNGPHIPFRPGREDWDPSEITPYDRLPDGAFEFGPSNFGSTAEYVRDIFYRMGFNDTEIVVLIGAHTLGECHAEWTGFFGPWTPDPNIFDNDFYEELVNDPFQVTPNSNQYYDTKNTNLMMLQTDLALVNDPVFTPIVKKYAINQAAWFKDFAAIFPKLQEAGVTTLLSPINW
jgi:cytochrome c peroxidase